MAADSRAHVAVAQAVAAGILPAAHSLPCADCGGDADRYHHGSYAQEHWLDVVPLCASCHVRRHRRLTGQRLALPAEAQTPISIRFTPGLAAELKDLAKEEHRSINGTVLEAVERYIRSRRGRRSQEQEGADGR